MAEFARVHDPETLKALKAALWKFAEVARVALADADGDIARTQNWLEKEQASYWVMQARKRHQHVQECMEALRQKKLYKQVDGTRASALEEEKALRVAKQKLEEAEGKLKAIKRWHRELEREVLQYRGAVQAISRFVEGSVPQAAAELDQVLAALEAYFALQAPSSEAAFAGSEASQPATSEGEEQSMARAEPDASDSSASAEDAQSPGEDAADVVEPDDAEEERG